MSPMVLFFASLVEILPANVAGGAIALINSFGALGSFAGSYIVGYFNGNSGGFGTSYILMAASLILSVLLAFIAIKDESDGVKTVTLSVSG